MKVQSLGFIEYFIIFRYFITFPDLVLFMKLSYFLYSCFPSFLKTHPDLP